MDVPNVVISKLRNIYEKNSIILNSQNSMDLESNSHLTKLYQSYWISNERLKNILEIIDTLNPCDKD